MLNTFDVIVIICGLTGSIMILASLFLLYMGVIKLGGVASQSAFEAQFRDQIRINVRNPALGLFTIGCFLFALALYYARPPTVVLKGHIHITDLFDVHARLKTDEVIMVSSDGGFSETVEPWEKLAVVIEVPDGYKPKSYRHQLTAEEVRNGHIDIDIPEFTPVANVLFPRPDLGGPSAKVQ